jgi:Ca-activated chloride channel family protein
LIKKVKHIIFGLLFFATMLSAKAQTTEGVQRTNILFLMDGSFSMRKDWTVGSKWKTATRTLSEVADSLSHIDNVYFGLRIFGHLYDESEANCKDSRLEVPLGRYNKEKFLDRVSSIRPKGITPIAYALEKASRDFGEDNNAKNILILITDGEESCEGNPCEIATMLQQKGVLLKPFVIGMSLSTKVADYFSCVGQTVNTNTDEEFNQRVKNIVDEAIAKTTIQVNLFNAQKQATETGVAMTFYDSQTAIAKHHFYHTLNAYGNPDTITISPLFTYDIQIHTLPERWIRNITPLRNKHSIVNVDAAQGELDFSLQSNVSKSSIIERIKCVLYQKDSADFFHVQNLNTSLRYLVGKYDAEILTLPRTYLKDIKIDPNKTTHLEIPSPGILTINKSYEYFGSIFIEQNKQLIKLYDLNPEQKQETLALQPGKYLLVYRSKFAKSGHNTINKYFEIESAGSLSLKL